MNFSNYCRSHTISDRNQKQKSTLQIYQEGLNATNPDDMASMLNKYFEFASSNITGESLVNQIPSNIETCICQIYYLQNRVF